MIPLLAVIAIPLAAAVAAYLSRSTRVQAAWVVAGGLAHLAASAQLWLRHSAPGPGAYLGLDELGSLVLVLVSTVFAAVACYAVGYLWHEAPRGGRAFAPCMLLFLAAATVVSMAQHLAVLWVAMEATTLATAPLIYEPGDRHSLEAVWKYLLLCSVGIALALLGTFFVAMAGAGGPGTHPVLVVRDLLIAPPRVDTLWFRTGVIFLVVGYGTKMGLVPMHSWLPDAHGEAPSPISALLSGALLNCAFLAILRVLQVSRVVGQGPFAASLLIGFGLLSLLVATALLLQQRNYKRLLACSSVEHMGILAIGVGVGGVAAYGALLHMLSASLAKAVLFLVAGNVLIRFRSKRIQDVGGMAQLIPGSAILFVMGLFALTGSPPYGTFLSEISVLTGAIRSGQPWIATSLVALQLIAFLALATRMMRMTFSSAPAGAALTAEPLRESAWLTVPPLLLLLLVLLLGLYIAPPLQATLARGAVSLGGAAP